MALKLGGERLHGGSREKVTVRLRAGQCAMSAKEIEMIDKEKIAAVKEELARLTKAIAAWEATPYAQRSWGSPESGAVKRASMDVSRALVTLRSSR